MTDAWEDPFAGAYASPLMSATSPWDTQASSSPLGATDWSGYFTEKMPSTGWWNQTAAPFSYGPALNLSNSLDYDPGSPGGMYAPASGMTSKIIDEQLDQWHKEKYPQFYDFTLNQNYGQGVAGVGKVAVKPGFGAFTRDADAEIQLAAEKYGVPANFLKSIIAKESRGKWSEENLTPQRIPSHSPTLGLIHGYVGVFEGAARSRGFYDLWAAGNGNRGKQIELLAAILRSQYNQAQKENPQYGWLNVAAKHYSGDYSGRTNPAGWEKHGTTQDYMARTEKWWKDLDAIAGNTWSNFTSTGQMTGIATPNSAAWQQVNSWDQMITPLAAKHGVPANLIKAIMRLESNGDPRVVSKQGATGLMQVMPMHVGGNASVLLDPETNIDIGARILADNYRRWGSWELAAKAYLAGNPYSTKLDAENTGVGLYWKTVNTHWQELNGVGSGQFGGAPGPTGPSTAFESIWGGGAGNISQGLGLNSFSRQHLGGMYAYSAGVGVQGHSGIDVVMPRSQLYSPVSGTVIRVGNQYYADVSGGGPNRGELRIRLDNGEELILGHMNSISVPVGSRVQAGMPVGFSGKAAGDQTGHIHIEYRIPSDKTSTGQQAVDPRQYLGGPGTVGHQNTPTGLGYNVPMSFQNLMRYAAMGKAIPQGQVFSQGGGRSGWNSWLRQAMTGTITPTTQVGDYKYTYKPEGAAIPNAPTTYDSLLTGGFSE